MASKEFLSDELRQRVENLARQENREASEILEEAVNRYAAGCMLSRLQDRLSGKATGLGIRESDVPELVRQVRRENLWR